MPLARGIRVLVVHIFCSPGGLASQPLRKKANHRDEADDAESQEGYHDDVHPPHVDHRNLTIYLTFPEQKAAHRVVDHTWSKPKPAYYPVVRHMTAIARRGHGEGSV
jgi:hypothetical protein